MGKPTEPQVSVTDTADIKVWFASQFWNWPNLGESTSIAACLPFFPVQNQPSTHQIHSSFTKSGPDPRKSRQIF
jgi:hypothetical protein